MIPITYSTISSEPSAAVIDIVSGPSAAAVIDIVSGPSAAVGINSGSSSAAEVVSGPSAAGVVSGPSAATGINSGYSAARVVSGPSAATGINSGYSAATGINSGYSTATGINSGYSAATGINSGYSTAGVVSGPSAAAQIHSTIENYDLIPVNYITISGYIPEIPYSFDDGVLLKTEEDLKAMDIQSLMSYASTISTSVAYETSTLIANKKVQATYSLLKQLSQSTIDGLDTEITVNNSLISGYLQINEDLESLSTSYVSTIYKYDNEIALKLEEIAAYNSSLLSYSSEYHTTLSSIAREESDFIIAATQYSSMYYIYEGFQKQYDSNVSALDSVNTRLTKAVQKKDLSYKALQESTARWVAASELLSSFYKQRKNIDSVLTRQRTDESILYTQYISSIAAVSTITSVYTAAVANETYALALSTAIQKVTDYSVALEMFESADLLYNNSIPQSGGGPSGTVLGNSALWAARTMAYQHLQTIEQEKIAAQNAADNLQNLAGLANTSAYEALLLSYDNSINGYATLEQRFRNYKISSLQAVDTFSSMFEESVIDIKKFSEQISMFNYLYDSSITAVSSLSKSAELELSSIIGDNFTYIAISDSISSLNDQYTEVFGRYNTNLANSTLYALQYYSSMSNVSMYTIYYDSTQRAIETITNELYGAGGLLTIYNNTVFTNSSILNKEILNTKDYETQIKFYTNLEDMYMYQYRETYCRAQRKEYQITYESNVYLAVSNAQNLTDQLRLTAAPGTTITPIAADLTGPLISKTYDNLNSMNTFLASFGDLYNTYDTQYSNITNLSTSIGHEGSAWSTVDFYTTAKYFNTPVISNIQYYVNNSCEIFASAQVSTSRVLNTFDTTQSIIDTKKHTVLSSLTKFFTQEEISSQTLFISTILIQSVADATAILQSQGITVI